MKTTELMLGDYVIHGFGTIGKVTALDKDIVTVYDKGLDDGGGHWEVTFVDNEIKPIPLTSEILKSNGILYQFGNPWYQGGADGVFEFRYHFREVGTYISTDVKIHIQYVHELQHALRLCNIKKEIVL